MNTENAPDEKVLAKIIITVSLDHTDNVRVERKLSGSASMVLFGISTVEAWLKATTYKFNKDYRSLKN